MKKIIVVCALMGLIFPAFAQISCVIEVDGENKHQTIHSFGASDCWRVQYVGKNWPLEKREKMADWLFSTNKDSKGNPIGIGLSIWRMNIGSGSHEAGSKGGVAPMWRRAECFMDSLGNLNWEKQAGQRWFLEAARKRGVPYTLGFSISAPYFMSINGMARADKGTKYSNLKESEYENYARFLVRVCKEFNLDYLSPINEPQWEWAGNSQEGMPATNREISRLMHYIDESVVSTGTPVKIAFGEAGDMRYLYRGGTNKPDRDNQIREMFRADGVHSISSLKSVAPLVTGHSYWSTWPIDTLITARRELKEAIEKELPSGYNFWQTEYCPMEENKDNPQGGNHRDLGMNTALYVGRVMHYDLVVGNATSWQAWTAITECDYKDGLIFIQDLATDGKPDFSLPPKANNIHIDGELSDSKSLWAMGNFSHFVRPGMVRLNVVSPLSLTEQAHSLMTSAYIDEDGGKLVIVAINYAKQPFDITLKLSNMPEEFVGRRFKIYETSENKNLEYVGKCSGKMLVPARSIVTIVSE